MVFSYIDPGTGFVFFSLFSWVAGIAVVIFTASLLFLRKAGMWIKAHKKTVLLLLLFFIFLGIVGKMMLKKESNFAHRIVVLGFDGLSPEVLERGMKEGKLPHFSRLKEEGSYSPLQTTNPPQSPVAWASFATGQNPGKHGVYDFIKRNPLNYSLDLSLMNFHNGKPRKVIQSKCFWEYTSQKHVPIVLLSCPLTFPPSQVTGKMLSGMGVPDILGTQGTFTFYTSEPGDAAQDIGGKVFFIKKSPLMVLHLLGPRIGNWQGKAEHAKVPVKVVLEKPDLAKIEFQQKQFTLQKGKWSGWQEVSFDLGFWKKAHGIFRFLLVETEPHFQLYISPIQFDPRSPLYDISYPASYSTELAEALGLFSTQGMPLDTWAMNEKRVSEDLFLEQLHEVHEERKRMLDLELRKLRSGILFCYFEDSDIVQHMFWRYRDAEHPLYEKDAPEKYKNLIDHWYQKMDAILGDVLQKIQKDDTLIVLSDHGFDTFRRAVHVNTWLRKNGYLSLSNPYSNYGKELLKDIDWSKTKAYSIGFGAIYLNQKGREKEGIVSPGEDSEKLKKEIAEKLLSWYDETKNSKIVNTVYDGKEIFQGNFQKEAPDLYLGFGKGYRSSWQSALGAVPEILLEDNLRKWSGDHLMDPCLIPGVLFCNRKVTHKDPSLYDIAPTILHILGFSKEEIEKCHFDGKPLWDESF